jgi:hypothetical protein
MIRAEVLPYKPRELPNFARLLDLPVWEPGHAEKINKNIFLLGSFHKLIDL